jgi:hypothetical protein
MDQQDKQLKQFMGESQQFNEQINNIKTQFFSALDDFTKYYVYLIKIRKLMNFKIFMLIVNHSYKQLVENYF